MKHLKMFALLAVAAAALMAFAGVASATELTSPKGTKVKVGTKIKIESEGSIEIDGSINITCEKAIGEGEVTNAGGASATVSGSGSIDTLSGCGNHTATVINQGTLEVHSLGSNTGTFTSSGLEVTVLTHGFFIGTLHCIYVTNNTHVGTVTGSEHGSSTTAELDIDSAPIPQLQTDGLCGNDAVLTGNVRFTSPDHIYID